MAPTAGPVADCAVFFGSEGGDAEEAARQVEHELGSTHSLHAAAAALDSISFEHWVEIARAHANVVVLCVSTTGDGEAPLTMQHFWRRVRRKQLRSDALAGVRYALFGLGDSRYPKFNAVAKRLDVRLQQLGARRVVGSVFSDESDTAINNAGHDVALQNFIDALLPAVHETRTDALARNIPVLPASHSAHGQRIAVEFVARPEQETVVTHESAPSVQDKWRRKQACAPATAGAAVTQRALDEQLIDMSVVSVERLSSARLAEEANDPRDVRHVVLQSCVPLAYQPGDVLHIMPRNRASTVRSFCEMMGLEPQHQQGAHPVGSMNQYVRIWRAQAYSPEPVSAMLLNVAQPCSVWELVSAHFDILSIPRRSFFREMARLASEPRERARLQFFASSEGADERIQYTFRERRSILAVLRDFPSVRPSLEELILIMPRLRARAFSLASSFRKHGPHELHVCVALVKYYSVATRAQRVGVCSSFIESLAVGDTVPCWVSAGTFRFTKIIQGVQEAPMILVGPGTGIAPFRSLLHELDAARKSGTRNQDTGDILVFFGCRSAKDGDFLYQSELNEWHRTGLIALHVAFSRDAPGQKVYVQHLIEQERTSERVANVLLHPNAHVFVAGSAGAMPRSVRFAFQTCLQRHAHMSEHQAEAHLAVMSSSSRYQVESWN
ncbi:NADPH-dependent diflavin oxidoreductase 1 [Porphyridium purpureum]|uniref:NADPH-dependent diflavin oxidoreductase 1 n=1 Tax=Porphyridium purpureum TaxID=35688 RepID=A0A5J4YPP0_PORPP|nr:NADPH-dependent diflavin oxidoreductase 1 [Porphyridium purpureum]|eukprot:POR5701..scf295_9